MSDPVTENALRPVITDKGLEAALAAATLGKPAKITHVGITERPGEATPGMEALPGEALRLPAEDGTPVNPHQVSISVLLREDNPGLSIHGIGFYLADGTLFAVYQSTAPLLNHTAGTQMLVSMDVVMGNIPSGSITVEATGANLDLGGFVKITRKVNGKELREDITLTPADIKAAPESRTINGKPLTSDVTLGPSDIGASPSDHGHTAADIGAVPVTRKVNKKALDKDITLTADDVGGVPSTRKVNNKTLSVDITLSAADVGASPSGHKHTAADVGAAPTGFGLGEGIPGILGGSLDEYRYNGWRTYNGDAGDTGGPNVYGTCLDFGHIGNGANYKGWAGQLFLSNQGEMFGRVNNVPGSFQGSDWFKFFTTTTPPTAAQCGAVSADRKVNGQPLTKDVTLGPGDVGAFAAGRLEAGVHDLNNLVGRAYFGQYEVNGADTPNWPWNNVAGGSLRIEGLDAYTKQIASRALNGETCERVCDHSGNWTNWELVYTSRSFAKWDNYASQNQALQNTVGCLSWSKFGDSHVVIDTSAGSDPLGATIDAVNPQEAWIPGYPTLMGWNGEATYGLRVDVARKAESVHAAAGEKGAIDLPEKASIRYRHGSSPHMHSFAYGNTIRFGHGENGENYMASLGAGGEFEANKKLQARGSQSRMWSGIGSATVHNTSADVSEGNLHGLITGRYHFPGVYDWETGYGTLHYKAGPAHVFFTSNAVAPGDALSVWSMTFDGTLNSPGFTVSKDGNVHGSVWGGWLNSYLGDNFAPKAHSHDYDPAGSASNAQQAAQNWAYQNLVQDIGFTAPYLAKQGETSSPAELGSGYILTGAAYAEYENLAGNIARQLQIFKNGAWRTIGY